MRHAAAPPLPAASAPRGPRCRGCGGRVMAASHAPAVASAAPVSRLLSSVAAADANGEWPGLRVAYQGCPGAYSEQASLLAYRACTPAPFDQFENAFEACEQFLVDRAVLPIENSLGGSIHRNYDLLLRHRLHIVGEVNLKVVHCLLALPGVTKADVKRVASHPQALSQVDGYLTRMGVIKESVDDTAGAAKAIAVEQKRDCAAVASARAAELYGLTILDEGIQDDDANVTRFLALAREPVPPREGGAWKTSIVFSLAEGAGVLFKALSCFALRGIDLTKIESRPMRSAPLAVAPADGDAASSPGLLRFSYLFYVDLAASTADVDTQNALRHLQEMAPFMRVLGCYPRAAL